MPIFTGSGGRGEALPAGSASAAAVAEAAGPAKALQRELAAAVNGEAPPDDPAPDAGGDVPEEPEHVESPTADPNDEPQPGDDYSEEDVAEYPDEDQPRVKDETHRKTWESLKTDDERAKALHEARTRLAELDRAAKEPKAGRDEPVAETAPDEIPDLKAVVARLSAEDPKFQGAVERLDQHRKELDDKARAYHKLNDALTHPETGSIALLREERTVLKRLEARAAQRPDDFDLAEQVKESREKVRDLNNDVIAQRLDVAEAKEAYFLHETEHKGMLGSAHNYAKGFVERSRADKETRAREKADYDRTSKDWPAILPKIFTKYKITSPTKQAKVDKLLLLAAAAQGDAVPYETSGTLESWMMAAAEDLLPEIMATDKAAVIAEYRDDKRADARQPAPRGDAAIAKPRPSGRLSAEQASRQAGEELKRRLGAR